MTAARQQRKSSLLFRALLGVALGAGIFPGIFPPLGVPAATDSQLAINTDTGAVPDPDALMACLREGFDEVLAFGGAHAPIGTPGAR